MTEGSTATTPQPVGSPVEVRPASEYPVAVTTSVVAAAGGGAAAVAVVTGAPVAGAAVVCAGGVFAALARACALSCAILRGSVKYVVCRYKAVGGGGRLELFGPKKLLLDARWDSKVLGEHFEG